MNKKEIEQIREDLELLKTNELIEIIIDQDEQLKKYKKESKE
tara:strand:- start:200 stop:325 length:126 start_codon:yes stop_codon:yes gene_type:complete